MELTLAASLAKVVLTLLAMCGLIITMVLLLAVIMAAIGILANMLRGGKK